MKIPPDAVVECGPCRLCCKGRHLVVLVPEMGDDASLYKVQSAPGPRGRPVVALAMQPNGDCAHLVDGECEVYDHRPKVCRAYDCRADYLNTPRAERRRRTKAGFSGAEVYERGRQLHEGRD